MRTVAVVLAGGTGARIGGAEPKQFLEIAGQTVLERAVAAFDRAPGVDAVLVVIATDFESRAAAVLGDKYRKLIGITAGGPDRPGSTKRAIYRLAELPGESAVLFHDAARPLVSQRIIAECVAALERYQAVGVVVPTADTIVEVTDGRMVSIPPRTSLARCQTPQGFRLSVIRRAHELADSDAGAATFQPTDDCGVVLRYLPDIEIQTVPGDERNLKITYRDDLRQAESLLAADPDA